MAAAIAVVRRHEFVSTDGLGFITCPLCGCACGLNLLAQRTRPDQPLSVTVLPSAAPGWGASGLCMRGWQIGEILRSRRRLRHPMAWREDGQQRVSWDEALAEAARTLKRLREEDPAAIGVVLGDSLSNEEAFAAREFAAMLGTPNVACLGLEIDAPAIHGLEQTLGAPYRAPAPEELDGVDLFICVNSNFQHINPRAAGAMARRVQQGAARMVLIDEVDQGLAVWSERYARHRPGTRADALSQVAAAMTDEDAGGPLSREDVRALCTMVGDSRRVALLVSASAIGGIEEALAVGRLARALRGEARWAGTYLLTSGANTFGTLDMLATDGRGPGGMSGMRMVASGSGLQALIVIGDDMGRLYGPTALATLRQRLRFGMVLSSFSSPNTELADLSLPVTLNGEREGTIRRPDGRLWWGQAMLEPVGKARRVEVVLDALAAALGESRCWSDYEAIWTAIRERVPGYRHVEPQELRAGELPVVGLDAVDVATVVDSRILTQSLAGWAQTDAAHPFVLVPRSGRGGWITDPRCQGAHLLRREATMYREPYVIMSQDDARAMNVRQGGRVKVSTHHGVAVVRVRTDSGIPPQVAVLPTEHPDTVRRLARDGEGGRLPTDPMAGAVEPAETR